MDLADKNIRKVTLNDTTANPREFKDNAVKTSKYSILTFLPKNLLEQFSKLANVYFLLITFM